MFTVAISFNLVNCVAQRIYTDTEKNISFSKDSVYLGPLKYEIDSVVIIYDNHLSIYSQGLKYNYKFNNDVESIFIEVLQIIGQVPPYNIYDSVIYKTDKVRFFFE